MTGRLYTPRQVVALNLARARQLRGLTQAQAAERVARRDGRRWSPTSWSILEGSVDDGHRSCHFDIDDLVALALAFELPIGWFLTPPGEPDARFAVPGSDSEDGLDFGVLLDVVFGTDEGREDWVDPLAAAASVRKPSAEFYDVAAARASAAVKLIFGSVPAACEVIDNLTWFLEALDRSASGARDEPLSEPLTVQAQLDCGR